MKKANVKKLEKIAADYLQYRYYIYLMNKRNEDWLCYQSSYKMIEVIGGTWKRRYIGDEDDKSQLDDFKNYSHTVRFPDNEACENLPENAWKL